MLEVNPKTIEECDNLTMDLHSYFMIANKEMSNKINAKLKELIEKRNSLIL